MTRWHRRASTSHRRWWFLHVPGVLLSKQTALSLWPIVPLRLAWFNIGAKPAVLIVTEEAPGGSAVEKGHCYDCSRPGHSRQDKSVIPLQIRFFLLFGCILSWSLGRYFSWPVALPIAQLLSVYSIVTLLTSGAAFFQWWWVQVISMACAWAMDGFVFKTTGTFRVL